jgi:hypothetical protein
VNEVRQLAIVGEELTESITVNIPLDLFTDNLVKGLANICETHKGQHGLRFILIDRVNKQKLKLSAPLRKVLAGSRLLDKYFWSSCLMMENVLGGE